MGDSFGSLSSDGFVLRAQYSVEYRLTVPTWRFCGWSRRIEAAAATDVRRRGEHRLCRGSSRKLAKTSFKYFRCVEYLPWR